MSLYESFGFAILRAPMFSIDTFFKTFPNSNNIKSRREYVKELLSNPTFLKAVLIATENLVGFDGSINGKTNEKALKKVLRYFIRMSTRPTPFGLFAGVSMLKWNDKTEIMLNGYRLRAVPSLEWLTSYVSELEKSDAVLKLCKVRLNYSIFEKNMKIYLSNMKDSHKIHNDISIEVSRPIQTVLKVTKDWITVVKLIAKLNKEYGVTHERAYNLIKLLVSNNVLITDLRPPIAIGTHTEYVARKVEKLDRNAANALRELIKQVMELEKYTGNDWFEDYKRAKATAYRLHSFDAPFFSADMQLLLSKTVISQRILAEIAKAADIVLSLSRSMGGSAKGFNDYKEKLEKLYGEKEISPSEAVDDILGIGPFVHFATTSESTNGDVLLFNYINQTIMSGQKTADITPILPALIKSSNENLALPPTIDLFVTLAARSTSDIDSGNFKIVIGDNVGREGAGKIIGRFVYLLEEDAFSALKKISSYEQHIYSNYTIAEPIFIPKNLSAINVIAHPQTCRYEILQDTPTSATTKLVIPFNEIRIRIAQHRPFLLWKGGKPIKVVFRHAVNPELAPQAIHLMTHIDTDMQVTPYFNTGRCESLPYLPRIEVGRIVLKLARWKITKDLIKDVSLDTLERFKCTFLIFMKTWMIPEMVYLVSGDNKLLLNLKNDALLNELFDEFKKLKAGTLTLEEFYPGQGMFWLQDDQSRSFVSELIVPIKLKDTKPLKVPNFMRSEIENNKKWAYIKLYSNADAEDNLLIETFTDLMSTEILKIPNIKWFFVKYRDPRDHVRIRIRASEKQLEAEIIPRLIKYSNNLIKRGIASKTSLDIYAPERYRYGGIYGVGVSENIFFSDSETIVHLLKLMRKGTINIEKQIIASLLVDDILTAFEYTPAQKYSFYQSYKNSIVDKNHRMSAEFKSEATKLYDILSNRKELENAEKALASLLQERTMAISKNAKILSHLDDKNLLEQQISDIIPSYVHMCCNRLLGVDKKSEEETIMLLCKVYGILINKPVK